MKNIFGVAITIILVAMLAATGIGQTILAADDVIMPVPPQNQLKDTQVIAILESQGINKNYVEKIQDYSANNPYTQIWRDNISGKRVAIISEIPQVNNDGEVIISEWMQDGSGFVSKPNLYEARVSGITIEITSGNNQPNGASKGDSLVYTPTLTVGGKVISLKGQAGDGILLGFDPLNPNYLRNTIMWDYGICKRYVRIIEGQLQGYWIFMANPNDDVQIDYETVGTLPLQLGQYAIDNDTEYLSNEILDGAGYPLKVGDSLTFYPDEDAESTSVDGYVGENTATDTWGTIKGAAGDASDDDGTSGNCWYVAADESDYLDLRRSIYLFDTSSLPDDCTIDSATFSIYGSSMNNDLGLSAVLNVYASAPASNTELVAGDYDSLGSTAYCDSGIAIAAWNTSGYNDFAFNSTGLAAISKTSVTKLGTRDSYYDVGVATPDLSGGGTQGARFTGYYSEQGEGYQPKLVVAYTPAFDEPTITTELFIGSGSDWAIVKGMVTDEGDAGVTQIGFDYGLTDGYGSAETDTGTWATGDTFVLQLSSLNPGAVYHYRAKGYNGEGGYGADMVFSTEGSPVLYEYSNTGGDADGDDIYGNNWGYEVFTADEYSHTITSVKLYMSKTGSPGTVTVSIRHADDTPEPTGNDICVATLDADEQMGTGDNWYTFEFTETEIEAGELYAIVVRALAGDDDNDIQWRWDAGGNGDATDEGGHSADGGSTWASDDPSDFLYEIWGNPCLDVYSGRVFQGYLEDGDLLFLMDYINIYVPYYDDYDPSRYFYLQLYDTDGTTLISQTVCPAWQRKPGSIYLNANAATSLTVGAEYYLAIYGDLTEEPVAMYQLQAEDWIGDSLYFLNNWVMLTANLLEDYYGEYLTEYVDTREVLNDTGSTIFLIGVPYLDVVYPDLFVVTFATHDDEEFTDGFNQEADWEDVVGDDIAEGAIAIGGLFNVGGAAMMGAGAFVLFILCALLVGGQGGAVMGMLFATPILIGGLYLRVIDVALFAVILSVIAIIGIASFWFHRS